MANVNSIWLKTKKLLRLHFGYHGDLIGIATRYGDLIGIATRYGDLIGIATRYGDLIDIATTYDAEPIVSEDIDIKYELDMT